MELRFEIKQLRLKETFSIAYGNYDTREALLVELACAGSKGYGECVAIDYYRINLQDFVLSLKKIQHQIARQGIVPPKDFFSFLLGFSLHPFLLSALDCAYWDLFGKHRSVEPKRCLINPFDFQRIIDQLFCFMQIFIVQ